MMRRFPALTAAAVAAVLASGGVAAVALGATQSAGSSKPIVAVDDHPSADDLVTDTTMTPDPVVTYVDVYDDGPGSSSSPDDTVADDHGDDGPNHDVGDDHGGDSSGSSGNSGRGSDNSGPGKATSPAPTTTPTTDHRGDDDQVEDRDDDHGDDGPNHDVGDDHGDDGPSHDVGDDHGGDD